jgi:hypothetical protein
MTKTLMISSLIQKQWKRFRLRNWHVLVSELTLVWHLQYGSIPIPVMQTYCTNHTELNPVAKKCQLKFRIDFVGTSKSERFQFSYHKKNHQYFCSWKVFQCYFFSGVNIIKNI